MSLEFTFLRSLFLRSASSATSQWPPLYSSRPRCRHPATPAAAAGSSQQHRQQHGLSRTLSAAGGNSREATNKVDHRRSPLPPLPTLLLRPPTCAPPRRASSAMRASSSGKRRWYFKAGRERRLWREKETEVDSAICFFSSTSTSTSPSPSLNSAHRNSSGLPQPPRRGLRRARRLQIGIHGAVLEVGMKRKTSGEKEKKREEAFSFLLVLRPPTFLSSLSFLSHLPPPQQK